jgi:hypothetical protein
MPAPSPSQRLHLALHLLTGGLLAGAAFVPHALPDLALAWLGWSPWLVPLGAVLALSGFLTHRRPIARLARGLCLAVTSILLLLAAFEGVFRVARYDFNRTEATLRRLPPFFRQPLVPTGEVFFRRAGPERWTGRVLATALAHQGIRPDPYPGEPAITIVYDALGFREESGQTNWTVAVAGDSFTELGHLPFDQLFTTRLARELGGHVRNLGVSHTGPLSHLHYLETYGLSPATRETLIVFFEGNDPEDLAREYDALATWSATGQRPPRGRHPQTSLLRAAHEAWPRHRTEPASVPSLPNAWFHSAHGPEPVTVSTPRGPTSTLSPTTLQALDDFLVRYAAFGHRHGVTPRLVYLPAKETVWRHHLTFADARPESSTWVTPTDLPDYLAHRCAGVGVLFLDLTPVLRAETDARRELLYNGLYDTHLNQRGSEVVARALAGWLPVQGGARLPPSHGSGAPTPH